MPKIVIRICGTTPLPFQQFGPAIHGWRTAVSGYAVQHQNEAIGGSEHTEFLISMDFFRRTDRDPCDLDNLAKPVIDTLFMAAPNAHPNLPAGTLFPQCGDQQVVELRLRKIFVATDQEEGATVEINW
ncbi:MAG TPA: hypothetical protein VKS81_00720 [Bacteroidota bacterium]|nr:hypothetical protein [Bacteroidota bacterium]